MNTSTLPSALLLLAATYPLSSPAAPLKTGAGIVSTDVCSVLKAPETFVNQLIRLRGLVYLGENHMNISDKACPGQGIELVIKSDPVFKQKDIHHFYVQMNRQGRKGVATITGLFQSDDSPLTPYVLNIQHVKDVAPRDK
jgi:hypothetical protein